MLIVTSTHSTIITMGESLNKEAFIIIILLMIKIDIY